MSDEVRIPRSVARSEDASPAILNAVLDTVVDAIVTIDETGTICLANAVTAEIFGYSAEELIGQNISLLMPEPHSAEHDGYLQKYLKTGERRIIGIGREVEARRRDGTVFPVDLAVSEVHTGGRRLFTGVIRDMTDRKQTETALRRERRFADDLLETANAIVVVLDEQGRIARFNSFLEHLTGISPDEVRGLSWVETFVAPEKRENVRKLFDRIIAGETVHSNVSAIETRDASRRMIAWSGRHLVDANDIVNGILLIGTDISELKEAEQKLVQSERLAAIGEMVTGLAHESRNALQRARACIEMLELDLADRSDHMELTARAKLALDELQRLYEEVRNYAAPVQLDLSNCEATEIWVQAWEQLATMRTGTDIQLQTDLGDASLAWRVDRNRMLQVFRNILENAVAASPKGGTVTLHCRDARLKNRPALQIAIRDSGPGIDEERAARVFEPFFTTKPRGTGLGLAIANRIVEAHSGEISVGKSTGSGAEFVIVIPRRSQSTTSEKSNAEQRPPVSRL